MSDCPECAAISRREFLKGAGAVALAAGLTAGALPVYAVPRRVFAPDRKPAAESLVKTLYASLTPKQREKVALPWTHANRTVVQNNWAVVPETVGEFYTPESEGGLRYDDPDLGLTWPLPVTEMSEKDREWALLADVEAELVRRMSLEQKRQVAGATG